MKAELYLKNGRLVQTREIGEKASDFIFDVDEKGRPRPFALSYIRSADLAVYREMDGAEA